MQFQPCETQAMEIHFDALAGPSHHHGGWSWGNLASREHRRERAFPKRCALEGLEKMKALADRGVCQAVLPPQESPSIDLLRVLGFSGSDDEVWASAAKKAPELFFPLCSAAAMWMANFGTLTASADATDGNVHITPANRIAQFHRSFEKDFSSRWLARVFKESAYFSVHPPLPGGGAVFSDEGAANQIRFSAPGGGKGVYLFVFGRYALQENARAPKVYPARQTYEAAQALVRLHQIDEAEQVVYAQQSPEAIDQGAFHNDLVSLGSETFFLFHERAFTEGKRVVAALEKKVESVCGVPLRSVEVKEADLPLSRALSSYLFNAQIAVTEEGRRLFVAPEECREDPLIQRCIEETICGPSSPVDEVLYVTLEESMHNGGGPACLRMCGAFTEEEKRQLPEEIFLSEELYGTLASWVKKHYREELLFEELADLRFLQERNEAFKELRRIWPGSIY